MKREKILDLMKHIPIVSGEQIAIYFRQNGSPEKRASEALKALETEKMIEGKRREIGKSKIWRLSAIGRKSLEISKPPLPFNTPKIEHVLEIGNIYQALKESGKLHYFQYEPKDLFEGTKVYAPDAFFIVREKTGFGTYLLEVQCTPLSTSRWAAKWAVASSFFDSGAYKSASWQIASKPFRPKIMVISGQGEEVIKAGTNLSIEIKKNFLI